MTKYDYMNAMITDSLDYIAENVSISGFSDMLDRAKAEEIQH